MSFYKRVQNNNETFKYQVMSQAKSNITLIVKTLLNEEKISTETVKSILENVEAYEKDLEKLLSGTIGTFLEKAFPYKNVSAVTAVHFNPFQQISAGESETSSWRYEYTITRTPKR